jgi:hypothetical protein
VPPVEPQPIKATPPTTAVTASLTIPANSRAPELLFMK